MMSGSGMISGLASSASLRSGSSDNNSTWLSGMSSTRDLQLSPSSAGTRGDMARYASLMDWIEEKNVQNRSLSERISTKHGLRRFIYWFVNWGPFNAFVMVAIAFNAVTIAIETDFALAQQHHEFFEVTNVAFLTIYTLEFLLKVFADPKEYLSSSYNRFDVFILFMSYLQLVLTSTGLEFTYLRVFRALRALRALRTISFLRSLQVIVTALLKTFSAIFNILVLLFLLMYVFAVVGYYMFGFEETGDQEHWGSLGKALLTLFVFVTADGWTDFQDVLDAKGLEGSRGFTILFIFIGHFIFTNLFIGVVIQNLESAQEEDKLYRRFQRQTVTAKKRYLIVQRQKDDLNRLLRTQKVNPNTDVNEILRQMAGKLRHDDMVPMNGPCTNVTWLETFVATLQHQENTMYRLQQLHFEVASTLAEVVDTRLSLRVGSQLTTAHPTPSAPPL